MIPTSEWKDVKKQIKTKFGKLNDSEIEGLNGHMDRLKEKVKQAYGYDEEKAKKECNSFNESVKKSR